MKYMAGMAGLEPVTSAVTGQRSNQLSYIPTQGGRDNKKSLPQRQVLVSHLWGGLAAEIKKSGQQTPRRWGWGTPLKKRAATRIEKMLHSGNALSTELYFSPPYPPITALRRQVFP